MLEKIAKALSSYPRPGSIKAFIYNHNKTKGMSQAKLTDLMILALEEIDDLRSQLDDLKKPSKK